MSFRNKEPVGRRKFLRTVGSASAAAAAGVAVPMVSMQQAQAYDPGKQELRARYRADSPEVQTFYRTNGYETLKK